MKRLPLIIILVIAIGCSRTDSLSHSLDEVEHLILANKCTASNDILDSIGIFIDEMPDSQKARYYYLHALSNKTNGNRLSEDTTLKYAVKYYRSVGDSANRVRCEVLYGNALVNAHIQEGRVGMIYLDSLLDASLAKKDTATAIDILSFKYGIYQESKSFLADAAIETLKQLYDLKAVLNAKMSYEFCYNQLFGFYYSNSTDKQRRDSSLIFFEHATHTCSTPADSSALYEFVLRNYISNLIEARQSDKAVAICRLLVDRQKNRSTRLSKIEYLDMAMVYMQTGKIDSAGIYLDLLEENISWYALERDHFGYIYNTMRILQEYSKTGHYSMYNFNRLNDYNRSALQFTIDRLKQSQRAQRLNAHRQLKLRIDRQRRDNWLLLCGVTLIAIVAGIVIYIKRHSRLMIEKEDLIESLMDTVKKLKADDMDSNVIKKIMLQQLGILKLVASNPTTANQELLQAIISVANREVDSESLLNWNDIYHTMDYVYNRFYSKLCDVYGNILNEQEIKLCCLLKSGFTTKEIMIVTQQSLQTVYQRKSSIRKKTGMPEKADIPEFIDEVCGNIS